MTRLKDIRNTVVADVKLTNEERLLVKGQKEKEAISDEARGIIKPNDGTINNGKLSSS